MSSHQQYSLTEAFNLLLKLYETHLHYIENGLFEEVRVPYLSGSPGTGKTTLTRNIAKHLSLPYHRIDMSLFEYYELKGLLYVDDRNWTTKIVELDVIPTEKCVLCIDEINAADYSLQKVIAGLVYERQIVKRRLNNETFIICCGNPQDTVEGMYDLLQHLKDRLVEIPVQPTFDELLVRVATISPIAYEIYRQNHDLLKRYFLQHKSLRPFTAAVYPIEQYIKTKSSDWLEVIRLHIPFVDEMMFSTSSQSKLTEITNIHDLLSVILNIDQFTPQEIQQLEIDNNLLFNAQQYCKTFGLLDKWKQLLLKLDENRRLDLAKWLAGD